MTSIRTLFYRLPCPAFTSRFACAFGTSGSLRIPVFDQSNLSHCFLHSFGIEKKTAAAISEDDAEISDACCSVENTSLQSLSDASARIMWRPTKGTPTMRRRWYAAFQILTRKDIYLCTCLPIPPASWFFKCTKCPEDFSSRCNSRVVCLCRCNAISSPSTTTVRRARVKATIRLAS